MKKILVLVVLVIAAISASASEKITVTVDEDSVLVKVGAIEFVTDNELADLKYVRVWAGPDSLLYDLSPSGINVSQNYSPTKPTMTKTEVAKAWAKAVEKFEALKKRLDVKVFLPKHQQSKG